MYLKWLQKYNLLAFEEIDSTNNEARRLMQSGAFDRLVIWSKNQTQGRGRYGRSWECQEGNLYLSVLLPINCSLEKSAQLSFVMGLALHDVLTSLAIKHKLKLEVKLKWPNDVLVNGNKISGILMESLSEEVKDWVVIGLGLNVENTPDIRNTTCLKDLGIKIGVGEILGMVMNQFDYYHDMWLIYDFDKIKKMWVKNAYKLRKVVTISNLQNRVSGIFEGVNKDGAIVLKLASGEKFTMSSGEVFFASGPTNSAKIGV